MSSLVVCLTVILLALLWMMWDIFARERMARARYRFVLFWLDFSLALLEEQRDRVNNDLAALYYERSEHIKQAVERGLV